MASVTYRNAERTYPGAEHPAVSDLNIDIGDGEFMVFVGPSGCGKSTSLRMLAGLEDVTAGDILIGNRSVAHVPPKDRDIAMVFQNYALYPHMTVADNMAFALKVAGVAKPNASHGSRRQPTCWTPRVPRAQTQGAFRWTTPTGGDGPGHRATASGVLHGEPLSNLDAKLRVSTARSPACSSDSASPPSTSPTIRSRR